MTSRNQFSFTRLLSAGNSTIAICNHLFLLSALVALPLSAQAQSSNRRLQNQRPALLETSQRVGRADLKETVQLALILPLRNEAQLDRLLTRLYDPADPLYHHFLSSQQFTAAYSPTAAEYERVAAFAKSHGLTVTARHANRHVLDVAAPAATVEHAFGVQLNLYMTPEGRSFRAPDRDPVVPASIADLVQGVVGLDTAVKLEKHSIGRPVPLQPGADPTNAQQRDATPEGLTPNQTGSGPGGGLTPSDIKTAYGFTTGQTGSGQTLGLFELDGYNPSDVRAYETAYGLPNVPLQNILIDGYSGAAGGGADEVTLDIELQVALAPGATKILVYEGPNTGQGVIDTYNRIATDNQAKSISTSWGLYEAGIGATIMNAENTIFKQMSTQGQTIFAASGDHGAYDNGKTLSVDDPASQPYMTGVGGTSLTTAGPGGAWSRESAWGGTGGPGNYGGGGGISSYWPIPSYQNYPGFVTANNHASSTMRNVPDVSLDADPNNGYSIFFNGGWNIFGGTSCAAPLWAAFTALVNQQRAVLKKGPLGFGNHALYSIGVNYFKDFHDIADGSSNLYYKAVQYYDLATGGGTFIGSNLLNDLAAM
jgi:subtilase family serine protease